MTYAAIRDAVAAAVLAADADVGRVHSRVRYARDWSSLLALLQHEQSDASGPRVKGWMLTRTTNLPDPPDSAYGSVARTYTFVLRGLLAFHDGDDSYNSDAEWQDTLDAVVEALDDLRNLNPTDSSVLVQGAGPCSVRVNELRMFGQVLAHYAEIDYPVQVAVAVG
jgi:hypothetical protein